MLFLRSCEDVSSPKKWFVFEAFSYGDGLHQGCSTRVHVFDELWGLNRKLYCWVWIWATLEFPLKAKNVLQSIAFSKHVMRLAFFGTFMGQCVMSIEITGFLEQADRCVMLWHSQCCVCIFLNVKKKGSKWILSSICLLTMFFCVFAFADHGWYLRMAVVLCTHQHSMGIRRW